jgi:hypothetical protein
MDSRRRGNCAQSAQILVHDDVFLLEAFEHAQPALAPEDADAPAAFGPGVNFDLIDQRQPALHVAATAGGDDADLAGLGADQDGRRRRLDGAAVPGDPQQAAAAENVGFEIGKGVQSGATAGGAQQRSGMRPDFVNPSGIDTDELSRGAHKGKCAR